MNEVEQHIGQRCIKVQDDVNFQLCLIILDIHPNALKIIRSLDEVKELIHSRKRQQLMICNFEISWDSLPAVEEDRVHYDSIKSSSEYLQRMISDAATKLNGFLNVENSKFSEWYRRHFNESAEKVEIEMRNFYKNKYRLQRSMRCLVRKYALSRSNLETNQTSLLSGADKLSAAKNVLEEQQGEQSMFKDRCAIKRSAEKSKSQQIPSAGAKACAVGQQGEAERRGRGPPPSGRRASKLDAREFATFEETQRLFLQVLKLSEESGVSIRNKRQFYSKNYKDKFFSFLRDKLGKKASQAQQLLGPTDCSTRLPGDPCKEWPKHWSYKWRPCQSSVP
ncbi:hypothetical protein GUITHDRAFT_145015 [Guillardia theta CCMP2712]|uniref:Uncharacterized protein n=2 Tax=Guillardia theta TaxID=55529 RepID=L1IMF1_GUITC|nr:hypothetical protein GUITHDRAFT_145015 [Guillardia theta CCMP2712]EKX37458.1 hypothetical protein GUITHDRAFT_145015 [Guillardia theta CCMP2712]|eukprot:XP_005824438.1 hypothetical protein GUITHDRAFT_145015 [Guillardia theta CCMP2712]